MSIFAVHRSPLFDYLRLFRAPKRFEDLALFSRHIAGAMDARAPLPVILRAYLHENNSHSLGRAIERIADRIEAGVELSAAMEEFPDVFPSAYRRLVRLGEQGKTLGQVMGQLADTMEEGLKTHEYFRRKAIYPLCVLVLLFSVVTFLMIKIIPKFVAIYTELGMELGMQIPGPYPWPDNITLYLKIIGFGLILTIALLIASSFGLRFKFMGYGKLMLELPLVGPVLRMAETTKFAHYLSLLLEHRLPMAEALGLLTDSSENTYVRSAMLDFQKRYESGERLSDLISAQPLFPAGMAALIASAEDQRELAGTLRHLARFYRERTNHGLMSLKEIYEPFIMILIGLTVGLVVLSIYLPLFYLPRSVG